MPKVPLLNTVIYNLTYGSNMFNEKVLIGSSGTHVTESQYLLQLLRTAWQCSAFTEI